MACQTSASNFQRKKAQMINEGLWKSNFLSLWDQYGMTKLVNGIECFDYYRIDGPGDGQEKMSKHLKQPTLWQEVQDDDLEWVHLIFSLSDLAVISEEGIASWISYTQNILNTKTFDRLHIVGVNGMLTEWAFYADDVPVNDAFLTRLAYLMGSRVLIYLPTFTINDTTLSSIDARVVSLGDHTTIGTSIFFTLPIMRDEISTYLLASGLGTEDLDALVAEGKLIKSGLVYALPVQTAREMGGNTFISLIQSVLNFDYKKETHWYDFFLEIVNIVLAGIAIYFGMYMVATSLMLSFVADKTGSKLLQIAASVVGIMALDITSVSTMGVSEAAKLLSNVYGLYMKLKYTPESGNQEEVVDKDQELFYKAPYSAYSQLYCYKDLTSVSIG